MSMESRNNTVKNKEIVDILEDEFVTKISDRLKEQGITVSPILSKLVLHECVKMKNEFLLGGTKVVEPTIGTIYPKVRNLRKELSPEGYTVLLRYEIDEELKDRMMDAVSKDVELYN